MVENSLNAFLAEMIERKNILELIGKHRGKYHSCILTCYSLDFSFFEERVLPTLRLSNVKNVNVLADGRYLELAQEFTSGREFRHNKTYNFQPIYATGVFHPKIMLLTGVKHGLLIIGSGNLTSAGLNTNDEIWGAFHLDNVGNENAPLFRAVWDYLQPFLDQCRGFIPQKIDWIRKHSPWLNELPGSTGWISLESLGLDVKFVANDNSRSTLAQLIELLPREGLNLLTTLAPYYDKSGQQVEQLIETFNPSQTRCLVDPNGGSLPTELKARSDTAFFAWEDCRDDYEVTYNRLHAKLLHFDYSNKEYLLMGSANVTLAGMGFNNGKAANEEAGILLRRNKQKESWLEELGINPPSVSFDISSAYSEVIQNSSDSRKHFSVRIIYAELRADELTIYLDRSLDGNAESHVLDRHDIIQESSLVEIATDSMSIKVGDPDNVFKVALLDTDGNRISNYFIGHRLDLLLRCNPDPEQEKLDAMLEQDFPDGEGITDLLQYVDYNWADENDVSSKRVNLSTRGARTSSTNQPQKEYQVLEAEEFNKATQEALLRQSGELSHATVKIAEFLSLYSSGVLGKEDNFEESEEQRLFEDSEQRGEGEEAGKGHIVRPQGAREKAAIVRYFKKLDEIYTGRLAKLFLTQALTQAPVNPITIRSLSSILIALHLIQIKYGKRFTVASDEVDSDGNLIAKFESFFVAGSIHDSVDSAKGFLMNVLGKYLLMASAGDKTYEFDVLNQKLALSQIQFTVKSISLIFNLHWSKSELKYRDMLLLNCLYFSLRRNLAVSTTVEDLVNRLKKYRQNSGNISTYYDPQLDEFLKHILPKYQRWLRQFEDRNVRVKELVKPTAELRNGDIVFNSKIGFTCVEGVHQDDQNYKLQLVRPGFPTDNDAPMLSEVQFGQKCVKYS